MVKSNKRVAAEKENKLKGQVKAIYKWLAMKLKGQVGVIGGWAIIFITFFLIVGVLLLAIFTNINILISDTWFIPLEIAVLTIGVTILFNADAETREGRERLRSDNYNMKFTALICACASFLLIPNLYYGLCYFTLISR